MKKKTKPAGRKLVLRKVTLAEITGKQKETLKGGGGFTVFAGCASIIWETRCANQCI